MPRSRATIDHCRTWWDARLDLVSYLIVWPLALACEVLWFGSELIRDLRAIGRSRRT